ncbi:MAG: beta-propeller domain-containing protein, partial [Myxococcota bacterium]
MRSKYLFTAMSFGALMITACDTGESNPPEVVQTEIALSAFDTCSELENYLEDAAVEQVNVHLDNLKNFRNHWWWGWGPGLEFEDVASPASDRGSDAPNDYTQTNTQVEGVDEADFVKTNGTHIFVLSGQKLYMTKSWPADEMAMVSSIEIEGYPSEMFLDEAGNVVVFSYTFPGRSADELYFCSWGCGNRTMTKVTVLSTQNDQFAPVHQAYMQGSYANARRIGSSIRVVMRDYLDMPQGVRWYPESFEGDPRNRRSEWDAAIEATKASNAALIRAQTLDDWLPKNFVIDSQGARVELPRNCRDFARSNAPVRLGVVSIGTLNLGSSTGASLASTSILGEVGEVYASREALYIATPHWWWWPTDGQENHTYLHKFDITNPNRATYRASGVVPGYPLNQFAMDEHNGAFRVATTIDRWVERSDAEERNFE